MEERFPSQGEFVGLMALLWALYAVSIDTVAPALGAIGGDLGLREANQSQYVISALVLGVAVGQAFYGPLSDVVGRRPAIFAGLAVFAAGSVLAGLANEFSTLLLGRVLQGLGAASPRSVGIAIIRDRYQGAAMARTISLVQALFVTLPIAGVFLGQGVLLVAGWRAVFATLLVIDLCLLAWFAWRLPETHTRARCDRFSWNETASALREVLSSGIVLGNTAAIGLVLGALFGHVGSARQIFQDIYEVGASFPFYFASTALSFGAAAWGNAYLVQRWAVSSVSAFVAVGATCVAGLLLVMCVSFDGRPPLWVATCLPALIFAGLGALIGNLTAMAMVPVGHVAGIAAGVIGSLSWLLAMLIGTFVGQSFDGTILPIACWFAALTLAATCMIAGLRLLWQGG